MTDKPSYPTSGIPGARCARCRVQLTFLHNEDACNAAIKAGDGPWWPRPGVELVDITPEWAQPEDGRFHAEIDVSQVFHGGTESFDVVVRYNATQGTVITNLASRKRANALRTAVLPFLNHPTEVERRRESLERMLHRGN